MRWLLLEKIVLIKPGEICRTQSVIPNAWVDSSILMVEMMAQTAGILLGALSDYRDDIIFTKMEFAEFFENCPSGQLIHIEATSECLRAEGGWFNVMIKDPENQTKIAISKLLLMNAGRLNPEINASTTFHPSFMRYFQVREKMKESGVA